MSGFEPYFAVSYYYLINGTDFREIIMASASRTLVVLKILVLGFQARTSTDSVFTA